MSLTHVKIPPVNSDSIINCSTSAVCVYSLYLLQQTLSTVYCPHINVIFIIKHVKNAKIFFYSVVLEIPEYVL